MPNSNQLFISQLQSELPDFDLQWLDSTGSTNADLMSLVRVARGGSKPTLLGTNRQVKGRGRAGRIWEASLGTSLTFSCAFAVDVPAAQLPALAPLAGIVACAALRGLVANDAPRIGMKWPNDIQWDDAKLAGILVETCRAERGFSVVIGIGINMSGREELSKALDRDVADWEQADSAANAGEIVAAIAAAWRDALAIYEKDGFESFMADFDSMDVLAGRSVNVVDRDAILASGVANGIDSEGRLLIVLASGGSYLVSIGEVSIRKATLGHH
jgi:BirA family biotin operon repressor/biotin-[acetyl-CoA-carboxylase] ligase